MTDVDFVVNATGHFSFPNKPVIDGMETFPGRVIHSGELRNPEQFKSLDVLVLGFGISGEDISTMLIKFGAKRVVLSYHRKPGKVKQFPEGVSIKQ